MLALSPMLASRYMGQGRMTTTQGRTGPGIPLWRDGGGPKSTGTDLPQSGLSAGITEGGCKGKRRTPTGTESTKHCGHESMEEKKCPKGLLVWPVT